jgi:hypothetical protein
MYGDMDAAPARELLFLPGGLTLDKYHELTDRHVAIELEPPNVQSFVGPIFLSYSVLSDHQMVASSLQALEKLASQSAVDITQTPPVNLQSRVVTLPPHNLFQTPLNMFDADSGSFQGSMSTNVHLSL